MLTRKRFSAVMFATAMAVLGLLFSAGSAHAQCAQITVKNNLNAPPGFTGTINLILVDQFGASFTWSVPGLGASTVITLPAGMIVSGVKGATGITHAFPAQPPRPACAQTVPPGATACIGLPATTPPPTVYCGTVCYDDAACTITISPCPVESCGP